MTRMFKIHIPAGLMALAVALSGLSATPARAGSDTARIITGLGALAIIGGAIASSHDDRRHGVTRYGYRGYGYGYGHHRGHRYNRHGYGYNRHGYGYNRHYRHYNRGYGYGYNRHYRHYNRGYGYGYRR